MTAIDVFPVTTKAVGINEDGTVATRWASGPGRLPKPEDVAGFMAGQVFLLRHHSRCAPGLLLAAFAAAAKGGDAVAVKVLTDGGHGFTGPQQAEVLVLLDRWVTVAGDEFPAAYGPLTAARKAWVRRHGDALKDQQAARQSAWERSAR